MHQKQTTKDLSRKDKRRHNLESKVNKIVSTFVSDKDLYYKDRLTTLQTNLTTLHQGNNSLFQRQLRDLQENRDFELVKLRLFEEYRVSRSGIEFQEDIEKAKGDHEKLVKLCKEKLYSKIELKIKKLKEERLLMDVANVHSYSMDYSRPFYQKNTRSHTTNNTGASATGLSGTGWESSSNEVKYDSATDTGTERRSLRRRIATSNRDPTASTAGGFSTNNEYYTGANTDESDSKNAGGYSTSQRRQGRTKNDPSKTNNNNVPNPELNSDIDFLQGISDYADLQFLLFGEKEDKNSDNKKKHRNGPRYSAKTAPPLTSLSHDEVTDDIAMLKSLTGQPPTPFKPRTQ